jgi:hypothetical protein
MLNTRSGQLPDSRRWRLLERGTFKQAERVVSGKTVKTPIKAFTIRKELVLPLVLVNTFCFNAKPSWRWTGKAYAKFATSKTGYNGADFGVEDLRLNRLQILQFPSAGYEPWKLEIAPAKWLPDVTYQVWEYRGFVESATQQSQRIEDKTDAILLALSDFGADPDPNQDYDLEDPDYDA